MKFYITNQHRTSAVEFKRMQKTFLFNYVPRSYVTFFLRYHVPPLEIFLLTN